MLSICDIIVSQKRAMEKETNILLGGKKILLALFSSLHKNKFFWANTKMKRERCFLFHFVL